MAPPAEHSALSQAEVLLAEFWDPASGAVFSEEGDQQRFWKLTRRFVEGLAAGGTVEPARVKVVSFPACCHPWGGMAS